MTSLPGRVLGRYPTAVSQLASSAVTLAASVVFARVLGDERWGQLAAFWILWMLLLSLLRAVFGEQLLANRDSGEGLGALTAAISLVMLAASLLVAHALGALPVLVLPLAFLALHVWSDSIRYERIHAEQARELVAVDVSRAAAGAAAVVLAAASASVAALAVLALTAVAWPAAALARGHGSGWRSAARFLRASGRFEGVLALQFLLVTGVSQALPLLAVGAFSVASLGYLRLAQTFASPVVQVLNAAQPQLLLRLRRTPRTEQRGVVWRAAVRNTVLGVVAGGAVLAGLALMGPLLLGAGTAARVLTVLPYALLAVLAAGTGLAGGALIRVRRLAGVSLIGEVVAVALAIGPILVALRLSIEAFAAALAAGTALTVAVTYALLGVTGRRTPRPASAPDPAPSLAPAPGAGRARAPRSARRHPR